MFLRCRLVLVAVLAGLALLLGGTMYRYSLAGENDESPAKDEGKKDDTTADESTQPEEELPQAEIDECKKGAQKTRKLEFKTDVKIGLQDRETLKKKMEQDFFEETPPERMDEVQKTLRKFGLIPKDFDLGKFLVDLLTEQIGGFYDPESKELYIMKGSDKEDESGTEAAMLKMLGVSNRKIVLVHELTHSLQDQHYDLLTMPRSDPDIEDHNDDTVSAVQALFEGEATYVMYEWMYGKMGTSLDSIPDIGKEMEKGMRDEMGNKTGDLMSKAPAFIRESLLFPYIKGLIWFIGLKKHGGWEAVNKAYADLPASTEQILHPKKYYGEERDNPTILTTPKLDELVGTDWKELDDNVVGQFALDIVMHEFFETSARIRNVAKGWDGDNYRIFDNPKAGRVLLVWLTTWDTEKDAGQFFEVYGELIPKKYKDAKSAKSDEKLKVWMTLEDMVSIEIRGTDVLVVESAPEGLLDKITSLVWEKTTKEEMKEVKRMPPPKKKDKKDDTKKEDDTKTENDNDEEEEE
ncbi:MAG: hypothetical protein RDV41_05760 [Planctomycetota bacterium]|nr:hypothetical protein [Planctomycetota bacterium]